MLHVRDQIGRFTWTAVDDTGGELYVVRQIKQNRVEFFSTLMRLGDELDFMPKIHYVGHDTGNGDGYCVIEDYVKGRTLRQLQGQYRGQYGKISSILVRLGSFLYSLRLNQIIHGDIKPDNIMVSDVSHRLYFIDFEFGQRVDENGTAPCLGWTPLYASKSQLDGYVTFDVDMRALGITILELFHGRHPIYQDSEGDPDEIARIVANARIESNSGGIFDLIARMCDFSSATAASV